jgi:hypothetical protein
MHNTQCDPATRPDAYQSCSVGISCFDEVLTTELFDSASSSIKPNENFDDATEEDLDENEDGGSQQRPPISPPRALATNDELDDETEEEVDEMQGDDPTERNRDIPLGLQFRMPRAERLVDMPVPNEPR